MESKKHIFIVGHNALLSSCELFCVDPTLRISKISKNYIIVNSPAKNIDIQKIGGIVKIGEFLFEAEEIEIVEIISRYLEVQALPKISFALSNYNRPLPLLRIGKEIKERCREGGIKTRFLEPHGQIVSTASLLFNQFTKPTAYEFLLTASGTDGKTWSLFRTASFQDLSWYTKIEQTLSTQDYRAGVLPVRLAQVLLNIAGGSEHTTLFDPFCGSGVLLGIGALRGTAKIFGTDVSPDAVTISQKHLEQLKRVFGLNFMHMISVADASRGFAKKNIPPVDRIVTEPYLGPPRSMITPVEQKKLGQLYVQSFRSFEPILARDARILFLFPVFRSENDFLAEMRAIEHLGFRRVDLMKPLRPFFPREKALIYKREGQRVGRLITLWERAEKISSRRPTDRTQASEA